MIKLGETPQDPSREVKITDVKKFLSTPERPVDMEEFKEFWDMLTDAEKEEFKQTLP